MEVVGAAASVTGIVGFTGQLLQGVIFLHDFFEGIAEVPDNIRGLTQELDALKSILLRLQPLSSSSQEVAGDEAGPGSLEIVSHATPLIQPSNEQQAALDFCTRTVTKLSDLVRAYDSKASSGRTKGLWAQLSTSLRQKKFEKHTKDLERGKSMLAQAYTLDLSEQILHDSHHTHTSLSNITRELSTLGIQNTRHANITTEIYRSIVSVEEDARNIRHTIATLFESDNLSLFSGIMQLAVERIVRDAIQEQLKAIQKEPKLPEVGIEAVQEQAIGEDTMVLNERNDFGKRRSSCEFESQPNNRRRRLYGRETSHDLWFGRVMISTEKLIVGHKTQTINTSVIFIPRPWLFRTGLAIQVSQAIKKYGRPAMNCSLSPIDIIPDDNPIFDAIKSGDLVKFRGVFDDQLVSPFGVTSKGENLLYKVIGHIFNVVLEVITLQGLTKNKPRITTLIWTLKRKDWVSQSMDEIIEMGTMLLDLGLDSGYAGHGESSPIDWLYLSLFFSRTSLGYHDGILRFTIAAFRAAKGNPLFIRSPRIFASLLKYRGVVESIRIRAFWDLTLESPEWLITSSHGVCSAIAEVVANLFHVEILQRLDGRPMDWMSKYWKFRLTRPHWDHRSRILNQLRCSANEELPQLKLPLEDTNADDIDFMQALYHFMRAIKAALLAASYRQEFEVFLDEDFVISSTCKDISVILTFHPVIPVIESLEDDVTLTAYSRSKQVLHVWIQAWITAGISLEREIVEAWILDRHLYADYVRFEHIEDALLGFVGEVPWLQEYLDDEGDFIELEELSSDDEEVEEDGKEIPEEQEPSFGEILQQHPAASFLF